MFTIALFWFFFSLLLALVEIEVEGKYGWAEKLPTWYRTRGWFRKAFGILVGSRPLTGYHLFMNLFLLLVIHIGFFNGAKWSVSAELVVFSRYLIAACMWDFLWFVLNPHYGIQNFNKNTIWWHSKTAWCFNLFPADYFYALGFSISLNACASWNNPRIMINHIIFIGWFLLFVLLAIGNIAPIYKWWHAKMRQRDDRSAAGIFHAGDDSPIKAVDFSERQPPAEPGRTPPELPGPGKNRAITSHPTDTLVPAKGLIDPTQKPG